MSSHLRRRFALLCLLAGAALAGCFQPSHDEFGASLPPVSTTTGSGTIGGPSSSTSGATTSAAGTTSSTGTSSTTSATGATSSTATSVTASSTTTGGTSVGSTIGGTFGTTGESSTVGATSTTGGNSGTLGGTTATSGTGGNSGTLGGTSGTSGTSGGACACMPPVNNGDLGQPCAPDAGAGCAAGERCGDPFHFGTTYCFEDCTTGTCSEGLCFDTGQQPALYACLPTCVPSRSSACPSHWSCNPLSPNPDEEGFCLPSCSSDADCANAKYTDTPLQCLGGVCGCTSDAQCSTDGGTRCDLSSDSCYAPCSSAGSCQYGCCILGKGLVYCDDTSVPPPTPTQVDGGLLVGEDCSAWWDSGQTGTDPCDCNQCMNTSSGKICTLSCAHGEICPAGWSCVQWYPTGDAESCTPPQGFTPHAVGGGIDATCGATVCAP